MRICYEKTSSDLYCFLKKTKRSVKLRVKYVFETINKQIVLKLIKLPVLRINVIVHASKHNNNR